RIRIYTIIARILYLCLLLRRNTPISTLFPYTTLFRSRARRLHRWCRAGPGPRSCRRSGVTFFALGPSIAAECAGRSEMSCCAESESRVFLIGLASRPRGGGHQARGRGLPTQRAPGRGSGPRRCPSSRRLQRCEGCECCSPGVRLRCRAARAGEDLVEGGEVVLGQHDVARLDRGVQLLHGARADDRAEHARAVQQPGERDLSGGQVPLGAEGLPAVQLRGEVRGVVATV